MSYNPLKQPVIEALKYGSQILQEKATKIIKFSHAVNIFTALHITFSLT